MKIVQILPELVEGGVERHVLSLSYQLAENGHKVMVISAGGKLVEKLHPDISHWIMPVHRKNPVTAFLCSLRIAKRMKSEGWNIIHAHSRVPAWISWWVSSLTGIPWMVTCHGKYSLNGALLPYKRASIAICVSSSLVKHLETFLPEEIHIVPNGLPEVPFFWTGSGKDELNNKFLFIGRLSKIKGIHDLIEIFAGIKGDWSLDVLGDGPLMSLLISRIEELGLGEKIRLHGFRDDTDEWLRKCSCLLFPSYSEGMPLTLARAIQMKVPVMASDIPPVREMAVSEKGLVKPGDIELWQSRIRAFLETGETGSDFDPAIITTIPRMTECVETLYSRLVGLQEKKNEDPSYS